MTAGVALLWSLFVASAPVGATSVVALVDRQNNRLVLAADCRVNRNYDSVSQCKIIEDLDCVVVIAGLYKEVATGFQLRQLVHEACREKGDLRSRAEAFLRISPETIRAGHSQHSPGTTSRFCADDCAEADRGDFCGHSERADCPHC